MGCLEDASKLQINGSIGKVEEEANAVAKQADSLAEVEVLFGDDLAVDPNVAYHGGRDDSILSAIQAK